MKKSLVFLGSCLVALALYLTACKEATIAPKNDGSSQQIAGKFSKELTVFNSDKTAAFTVALKSDLDGVLDHLSTADLTLAINPAAPTEVNFENAAGEAAEKPTKFVSIEVIGVQSDVSIDGYTLGFSEAFEKLLNDKHMGMQIGFGEPTVTPMTTSKTAGSVSCCKKVRVKRTGTATSSISFDLHWGTSCSSSYSYACSGTATNYTDRSVCYCGNASRFWRWISVYGTTSSVTTYSSC